LHATQKAFADRSLLHDENESLLKQNDEKRVRQNMKSTVISRGNARILSYADIVEMQRRRTAKTNTNKAMPPTKRKQKAASKASTRKTQTQQSEDLFPPCPGKVPVAQMW
jgi:hypothetical protein